MMIVDLVLLAYGIGCVFMSLAHLVWADRFVSRSLARLAKWFPNDPPNDTDERRARWLNLVASAGWMGLGSSVLWLEIGS